MMIPALGSALIGLLSLTTIADLLTRRIPNAVVLALAAAWLLHPLGGASGLALTALLQAGFVLAVGFVAWRRGLLGGGDVKLLSVLALWATSALFIPFLLLTALLGGGLALVWLGLLRMEAWLPSAVGSALRPAGQASAARPSLPYGVAISVAGMWLVHELFWA